MILISYLLTKEKNYNESLELIKIEFIDHKPFLHNTIQTEKETLLNLRQELEKFQLKYQKIEKVLEIIMPLLSKA
jgi:hypothetical protein